MVKRGSQLDKKHFLHSLNFSDNQIIKKQTTTAEINFWLQNVGEIQDINALTLKQCRIKYYEGIALGKIEICRYTYGMYLERASNEIITNTVYQYKPKETDLWE
jgi:hypothetical protein